MNILVTGGLGYIGSYVIPLLQKLSNVEKIIIYDNFYRKNFGLLINSKLDRNKIELIQGDILDGRKLRQVVSRSDIILHLAAKVSTPYADGDAHFFEQINHWGTAQLVDAIKDSEIKHLIYLSSSSVYGSPPEEVNENSPTNPTSFYGISKFNAEFEILRLENEIDYHTLRCSNVYGFSPALRIDAVINKFMFQANFNKKISIFGDGSQSRPFIHIDKLAQVIIKLLAGSNIPSGTYNVFEHNYSINEVVDSMRQVYPHLEAIGANKDYNTRSLKLKSPCTIMKKTGIKKGDLIQELKQFKSHFSF